MWLAWNEVTPPCYGLTWSVLYHSSHRVSSACGYWLRATTANYRCFYFTAPVLVPLLWQSCAECPALIPSEVRIDPTMCEQHQMIL